MTVDRHRVNFYQLLKKLSDETKIGYWRGSNLDEMHVQVNQLARQHIWDEWISTFDPGKDWFRVGMWYPPEAEAISEDLIFDELTQQIQKLLYNLCKHTLVK